MEERFTFKKIMFQENASFQEYCLEVTNETDEDAFLSDAVLFETDDLKTLGLDAAHCRVYRSGRQKNDMPSVFTFGVRDDAMEDAMGGLTETGANRAVAEAADFIRSDHLTVLGNDGNYVFLTFESGKEQLFETMIDVDKAGNFLRLQSRVLFNVRFRPHESRRTEIFRIERIADAAAGIEAFAKRRAERDGARNSRQPSVFCTWYYYGLTVSYDDVHTNIEGCKREKLPFDVFQVDEGWSADLGIWEANEKFPCGMKAVADEIREAGMKPGIWTSPFIGSLDAPVFQEHPEWTLKDAEGNRLLFPMNGTVYYIFDITNPATWDYFEALYRKLTFEWGYVYHKLDFTRAPAVADGAVFFDDTMTVAKAYRKAVEAIRRGMGEDAFFLMCGGLYDPLIDIVDGQRSGSDVLSIWGEGQRNGLNGKNCPFTIKQNILRWYMNEWWVTDPDALMVRRRSVPERDLNLTLGLLTDDEVKTSTVNQFIGGGLVCSTEPLDQIDRERLYELRHIMPTVHQKVRPRDIMASGTFPENMLVLYPGRKAVSLVRINWSDHDMMPMEWTLTEDLLPEGSDRNARFTVSSFYGHELSRHVKLKDRLVFKAIPPHAAEVFKIEEETGAPMIVFSDGHYSMGAEGVRVSEENGRLSAAYDNPFSYPVVYGVIGSGSETVEEIIVPAK